MVYIDRGIVYLSLFLFCMIEQLFLKIHFMSLKSFSTLLPFRSLQTHFTTLVLFFISFALSPFFFYCCLFLSLLILPSFPSTAATFLVLASTSSFLLFGFLLCVFSLLLETFSLLLYGGGRMSDLLTSRPCPLSPRR